MLLLFFPRIFCFLLHQAVSVRYCTFGGSSMNWSFFQQKERNMTEEKSFVFEVREAGGTPFLMESRNVQVLFYESSEHTF